MFGLADREDGVGGDGWAGACAGGGRAAVGVGGSTDREAGSCKRAADQRALQERASVDSPMLRCVNAVHTRPHPRACAGCGVWVRGPARRGWPDRSRMRSGDARQLRTAGRRGHGVAAGGQSRRLAADADQLPRRAGAGSQRDQRRRLPDGRTQRPPGPVLARGRCELRAVARVRRRRACDRARAAAGRTLGAEPAR